MNRGIKWLECIFSYSGAAYPFTLLCQYLCFEIGFGQVAGLAVNCLAYRAQHRQPSAVSCDLKIKSICMVSVSIHAMVHMGS